MHKIDILILMLYPVESHTNMDNNKAEDILGYGYRYGDAQIQWMTFFFSFSELT